MGTARSANSLVRHLQVRQPRPSGGVGRRGSSAQPVTDKAVTRPDVRSRPCHARRERASQGGGPGRSSPDIPTTPMGCIAQMAQISLASQLFGTTWFIRSLPGVPHLLTGEVGITRMTRSIGLRPAVRVFGCIRTVPASPSTDSASPPTCTGQTEHSGRRNPAPSARSKGTSMAVAIIIGIIVIFAVGVAGLGPSSWSAGESSGRNGIFR